MAMTPRGSPERRRRRRTRRRRRLISRAATLPNDLIFDILSRLPLRSVCRFRCVCKEWNALVSDLAFVAAHKSRHDEPLIVVSYSQGNPRRGGELRLMGMDGTIVRVIKGTFASRLISTSIDELICVTNDPCEGVHVIDPASGKVLVDCQHFYFYGFGRAVPSGAYKVVRIKNNFVCEVLTLGEDTGWRLSRLPPTSVYYTGRPPLVVNGVMYFSATLAMYNFNLHRFDLEIEQWKKTIKGPEITVGHDLSKSTKRILIVELNGALCIVQSEIDVMRMTNNKHVNIWFLTDPDKSIWMKAYTIPIAESANNYRPLRVTHDGGKLIFYCTNRERGEFRVYNTHTKTCALLWKLDKITDSIGLCNLHLDHFV